MKNMFSHNTKNSIPESLKECCKNDSITNELITWGERIEKWGTILFVLLSIVGLFDIIISAITVNENTLLAILVSKILLWALYIFIEYVVYHIIALIFNSLATISQNTKIAANIALYTAALSEPVEEETENPIDEDGWMCNSCGAVNEKNDTHCKKCGASELFNY